MPQSIHLTRCLFSSFIQFRLVLILFALAAPFAVAAISPAQQQDTVASSSTDDGPQLRVSTPKSTYRQGELIPLDLAFTAKDDKRYQINMATYDRSGRMSYENFHVEPADGTSDPVAVYFKSQGVLMMGGLTNFRFLSDTAYIVHLNLNEWVRFDKPGNYRVTLESSRVGNGTGDRAPFGKRRNVVSNALDIQVIAPDSAWEQSQLKRILAEFDASPPPKYRISSEQRLAAASELRYLGSPEAAREMARHLRGDENQIDWQCMLGLIGSPNKEAGLVEMKRLMVDSDFPVSQMFLSTMALLPLDAATDEKTLQKEYMEGVDAARAALRNTLPVKRGQALAAGIDAALRYSVPHIGADERSGLVPTLIEHFDDLSTDQKSWWLGVEWDQVKGPEWLPTVRKIAQQYTNLNESPTPELLALIGSALTRWYELDPEGARPAVLAEIVRPKPRYTEWTLGLLPDKVLPNEEHAIADHFLATDDANFEGALASLLLRYADAAVLNDVLPKIARKLNGPSEWACEPEENAIAYVEKVAPEKAKPLRERMGSSCR